MALIRNLADHLMISTLITAHQPADDRLVIVQDFEKGKIATIGARFRNGRWFGEATGYDLTSLFTSQAIWTESHLHLPTESQS